MPDYEVLDEILKGLVEKEISIEKIISNGFQRDDVEKVSKLLARSEYKRFQSAPGPKVTSKAFGKEIRRFHLQVVLKLALNLFIVILWKVY